MKPRIPILLYHRIVPVDDAVCDDFDIPAACFREDMKRLHAGGWRCVSASEAARLTLSGHQAPGAFALTFDDGYRDFADLAYPILADLGYTATVFVVTGRIGATADWLTGAAPDLLDVDDIRRLAMEGIQFGSHGVTHVSLPECSDRDLARELNDSRAVLSEITGQSVPCLAWPYGEFDGRTRQAAAEAGYGLGFAVAGAGALWTRARAAVRPSTRDALAVSRREVHRDDSGLRRRLRMGPVDGLFVTARKLGFSRGRHS